MPYYSKEIIDKARQVDLLSYLQLRDPGNLIKTGYDTYCTRDHDSLKISNGKWFWFSRQVGGVSAIDYLMKVHALSFTDAVAAILDGAPIPPVMQNKTVSVKKELKLPGKNKSSSRVEKYLQSRCIHPDVIHYCIDRGILYESVKYHNAVFVGYNEAGEAKYAMLRSTYASFKGEASGSDKTYSFRIAENPTATDLHIFEAAIDLLSLASIYRSRANDWLSCFYLSLGGVSQSSTRNGLPKGLSSFLSTHPAITTIHLHLDNDEPGRTASDVLSKMLGDSYTVLDEPPPIGKDMNEYIVMKYQLEMYREENLER